MTRFRDCFHFFDVVYTNESHLTRMILDNLMFINFFVYNDR